MLITRNAKYAMISAALLVCAPLASLAQDGNALADASFEDQLAPDQGGWTLFDGALYSDKQARNGDQSVFNSGYSRTVSYQPYFVGAVSGSFQEFPAAPGSRWRLTGYGLAENAIEGTPAFGIVQVTFFDADGNDIGTVETAEDTTKAKTSNEVNSKSPAGEWVELDTGIATAPEGTVTVQAFTIYVDYSGSNLSQGVYFDDLYLCQLADGKDVCE